jgi:hypothetical protein
MSVQYDVEYTDTFGGDANYSWVERARVAMPEMPDRARKYAYDRELMRRAKAAVGLNGVRGVSENNGTWREFRPYGCTTVLFITYHDA